MPEQLRTSIIDTLEFSDGKRIAAAGIDAALTVESDVFRITHVQSAGPKGGRPIERDMMVNHAGLQKLLDTCPATDRIRLADKTELACRGVVSANSVDALVPLMSADQLNTEILRRQHRALADDLEVARRAQVAAFQQSAKNTVEGMEMHAKMYDTMQLFMEKMTDQMLANAKQATEAASGDLVERTVAAVIEQFMGGKTKGDLVRGLLGGRE